MGFSDSIEKLLMDNPYPYAHANEEAQSGRCQPGKAGGLRRVVLSPSRNASRGSILNLNLCRDFKDIPLFAPSIPIFPIQFTGYAEEFYLLI